MSRSILIMAGGTGGHIFSSDLTRKNRAFPHAGTRVCTENMTEAEVLHG
jgi:UDP-N-acetylglucosamine:LPS N-acetylglucosamine transferase